MINYKLTDNDFKNDMDWYSFGEVVTWKWKKLRYEGDIYRGKCERYPNKESMKFIQEEFNATQSVIRYAIYSYLYS